MCHSQGKNPSFRKKFTITVGVHIIPIGVLSIDII